RLGGKGDSLARLLRAGFDVPPGFVLTPEVTTRIDGGALPGDLETDLREAWERLSPGGEPVAVRSSALDEDSAAASFAGQHETVLGVTGFDALKEAVAACVASLHATSADAYRAHA